MVNPPYDLDIWPLTWASRSNFKSAVFQECPTKVMRVCLEAYWFSWIKVKFCIFYNFSSILVDKWSTISSCSLIWCSLNCIPRETTDNWLDMTWWRHQMETFSVLLAICAWNSPVHGEFPAQRPVTGALMFSLICFWINYWVNNREAGDLRCHRAHYDVIVMSWVGDISQVIVVVLYHHSIVVWALIQCKDVLLPV